MSQPKVSHCANPRCGAEFKRLGQGRLFIKPEDPKANANASRQKVIWLCDSCAREFEVAFDQSRQSYRLVRRERIA